MPRRNHPKKKPRTSRKGQRRETYMDEEEEM